VDDLPRPVDARVEQSAVPGVLEYGVDSPAEIVRVG
jgi:hypothetical protein